MSNPDSRSCLFIALGLFIGLLLMIFVSGNVYSAWQLERAHRDLLAVAQQLGYTPEAQLAAWLGRRDTSIVTGTSTHTLDLYYVVAMSRSEFEALLTTVDVSMHLNRKSTERSWEDFIAVIGKENGMPPAPRYRVHAEDTFSWIVHKDRSLRVDLYQIPEASSGPKYHGRELTGCLIDLGTDAANIPIWRQIGVRIWEKYRGY
ncbi:MAG: hypothetical protein IT190_09660 [Microbacteriaceae bacterium]|nr:hypothetical protein [Microbacteriaceae bacterium]